MTAEEVNLRTMTDEQFADYSAYWLQCLDYPPECLTYTFLRLAANDVLKEVRREAKRRIKASRRAVPS